MSSNLDLEKIKAFRQELHRQPETAGQEANTALKVKNFLSAYNPDEVISEIGGHGLVAIFKGKSEGKTVAIRAELDALPIHEINEDIPYRSECDNTGHKCGHDGHMAIVAGLASYISNNKPDKGSVVLLFQPAEETGQGAQRMLDDPKFKNLNINYIYALHNMPGYAKNSIILKEGIFASASKGLVIKLTGRTSHAAEPENGSSPAQAVAEIIQKVKYLPDTIDSLQDFTLVTIVHARLGEKAFGTTPGEAVVMATLRAFHDGDLSTLDANARKICEEIAEHNNLQCAINETEVFSSTINGDSAVKLMRTTAQELGLTIIDKKEPFRWSEDFGLFSQRYEGGLFGLGAGEKTPSLHNPDYDFPDEIIPTGCRMFKGLIEKILN